MKKKGTVLQAFIKKIGLIEEEIDEQVLNQCQEILDKNNDDIDQAIQEIETPTYDIAKQLNQKFPELNLKEEP